ncbi:hypothetical protein [Legionella brunensis]|nr:hypothetical protein [Legionella brunensis]
MADFDGLSSILRPSCSKLGDFFEQPISEFATPDIPYGMTQPRILLI